MKRNMTNSLLKLIRRPRRLGVGEVHSTERFLEKDRPSENWGDGGPVQLRLNAAETDLLPAADSIDDLFSRSGSSYFTLIPGNTQPIASLYPNFQYYVGGPVASKEFAGGVVQQLPLHLFMIESAYFFPLFGVVILKNGAVPKHSMEEASYHSPDLSELPYMKKSDDGTFFTRPASSGIPLLKRAAVTFPWGAMNNYGHFVLDCLAGVAALAPSAVRYGFPLVMPTLLYKWQTEYLDLSHVKAVSLAEPLYRVDRLVFTSCMGHFLQRPNSHMRSIARMLPQPDLQRRGRRIYLSRSGNAKRTFLSEKLLTSALIKLGFDVVFPETLSIADQISLFSSADVVVGNSGAAFANIIYCRANTLVVEVQPDRFRSRWVRNICAIHNLRWAVYFCQSTVFDDIHPECDMQFDYDVDDFINFIEKVR